MLTKEQEPTEPWGDMVTGQGMINEKFSIGFFVLALIAMFLSEADVIQGLWSVANPALTYAERFLIPLYVLMPYLMGLTMRIVIGKMSRIGQISLPAAANLKMSLGILLMISYISIHDLAENFCH